MKRTRADSNDELLAQIERYWLTEKRELDQVDETAPRRGRRSHLELLAPGVQVPCGARDAYVGKVVPGPRGGRIVGCASPSKETLAAVKAAQAAGRKPPRLERGYVLADGRRLKGSVARGRIRDAGRGPLTSTDRTTLEAYSEAWREGHESPYPIGQEFPHRAGGTVCDPEHPEWAGYPAGDVVSIAEHPRFRRWAELADKCVQEFEARTEKKAPKAGHSAARERAQARARAQALGEDLTATEYLERSRGGQTVTGKRRKRRKK